MRHAVTGLKLVFCLALLSAGPAFTQSPAEEEISEAKAATTATDADVYVQTEAGVTAYSISSSSAITEIKGSPFYVSGQMEAINGKYLISVGTKWLHVYKIESNGAIGEQVSSINTHDYPGSQCRETSFNGNEASGAFLDHTGKYLYVQLYEFETCDAWQSYRINENGSLTFIGDLNVSKYQGYSGNGWAILNSIPTFNNTDKYAYGMAGLYFDSKTFSPYIKSSNGALVENTAFTESDPETPETWGLSLTATDPSGHLAAVLLAGDNYFTPGEQLASYTIDPKTGGISSSNTELNMPVITSGGTSTTISMSYAGDYVAVAGGYGIKVFNFNGAAPPTVLAGWSSDNNIDQLAWDKANRLYALSPAGDGPLYVFNVTSAGLAPIAGTPLDTGYPYGVTGLIVVPKV